MGERRGIGRGGEGEPWYIIGKDIALNEVYVERGANHPALFAKALIASRLTWIHEKPRESPFSCTAKIRYRQQCQSCTLHFSDNEKVRAVFDMPQRAITPGQSIVFYQGDVCLGGGRIDAKDEAI